MNTVSAVSARGLTFAFPGDPPALEDVTFTIAEGDFASVVGPNGGGKTTLLRLLLGLLKPTRGEARLFGQPPEVARRQVGYLAQRARLDPHFPVCVRDVVLMGRLGPGRPVGPFGRGDKDAARRALAEVGLADAARRPFAALSGGQKQRALIARALACEPRLLLLDEPTASLDQHVEGELFALLRELNRRLTVIIVSHDLGFVSRWVRTVVCVNRRVAVHPTGEVTAEIIREMYGDEARLVRHDRHATDPGHPSAGRPGGRP